jgi:hypothetical protein
MWVEEQGAGCGQMSRASEVLTVIREEVVAITGEEVVTEGGPPLWGEGGEVGRGEEKVEEEVRRRWRSGRGGEKNVEKWKSRRGEGGEDERMRG